METAYVSETLPYEDGGSMLLVVNLILSISKTVSNKVVDLNDICYSALNLLCEELFLRKYVSKGCIGPT